MLNNLLNCNNIHSLAKNEQYNNFNLSYTAAVILAAVSAFPRLGFAGHNLITSFDLPFQ